MNDAGEGKAKVDHSKSGKVGDGGEGNRVWVR